MINQKQVAKEVFDIMFPSNWQDETRKEKALKDVEWTLSFIVQSVELSNSKILSNYYLWLKKVFQTYQLDSKHIDRMFDTFKAHLLDNYGVNIGPMIDSLPIESKYMPVILENNVYDKEMKQYLDYVLSSKRGDARKYIHHLIENGMSIEDVYLYVFQEALRNIGEMWLSGEISVAMEHYFTATTQYIMSTLFDQMFSEKVHAKRVLACAVGSELHEVGIRMVADLFEINGWDSRYLGASVPIKDIVAYAQEFEPDVIALSITMEYHVIDLKNVVDQLKTTPNLSNTKIIIGGLPFINNEELFDSIGADGYSTNALEGIRLANELI